jgi:hypothetical protein
MRRRPRILIFLAIAHLIAPFINLLWDAKVAHAPLNYYIPLFFQPHNLAKYWIHFFGPMAAGVAILIFRKWSFFLYVAIICAMAVVSYQSFLEKQGQLSAWVLVAAYFVNFFIIIYFFFSSVRKIYPNPKLRWWQTKPRYRLTTPCEFSIGEQKYSGMISNFSVTGLFVKAEHFPPDQAETEVEFQFKDLKGKFKGTVIRHARAHLEGFGVRFDPEHENKSVAQKMAKEMHSMGLLMKDRAGAQDTFWNWFMDLVTTGKGITPTLPENLDMRPEKKSK